MCTDAGEYGRGSVRSSLGAFGVKPALPSCASRVDVVMGRVETASFSLSLMLNWLHTTVNWSRYKLTSSSNQFNWITGGEAA